MSGIWQTTTLGEACQFINGLWKGEVPPFTRVGVIRNTNFTKDGELDDSDIAYLDVETKKFVKRRLQAGDLILEKSGGGPKQPVGRVVLFDKTEGDFSFSNFTAAIRVNDVATLDPRYLHRYLHWFYLAGLTDPMQSHSTGIRNLNGDAYKAIAVTYPPVPEQRRIVAILDEALEGIAVATVNAQTNLRNAREWAATQLSATLRISLADARYGALETLVAPSCSLSYGIVQPGDDVAGGLPVVRPVDLGEKTVYAEGLKRIDPALARSYARTTLEGNDLLLCVRGTTGVVGLAEPALAGANVTRGIVPIRFDPRFISQAMGYYLLRSDKVQAQVRAKTYGAALLQINIGDLRKIVIEYPPLENQAVLVKQLDAIQRTADQLVDIYARKLACLDELKKSLLQQAFNSKLTLSKQASAAQKPTLQTTTPEFAANVIALAHARHERQQRERTFGRVKEQKTLHLVEAIAKIDLGRQPMRDAAGPNDFQHMLRAEEWARTHDFFEMVKRDGGYGFKKLSAFDEHLVHARERLKSYLPELEHVIDLLVPMDKEDAEVFTTVHAAWNNLVIDGVEVTDGAIVSAARENWHVDKLSIPEHKFRRAIALIRQNGLVPDGTAKYVGGQQSLL